MIPSGTIEKMLSKVRDLPPLPSVVLQVNRALKESSVSIDEIGGIIEKDASLTVKLLKIANSSYYGLSYNVDTVTRAVSVLGFDTVRNIAVTLSMGKVFSRIPEDLLDVGRLWNHSLGCAIAAKILVGKKEKILREEAFICGIVHDIGQVVIAQNLPEAQRKIRKRMASESSVSLSAAEIDELGFTHAEVGAYLADKWHFPTKYAEAIRFHHNPCDAATGDSSACDKRLVAAVFAGNMVAKHSGIGFGIGEASEQIPDDVWGCFGRTSDDLDTIVEETHQDFNEVVAGWGMGG
ncbi:MAG: HDOD domain-containing protein [Nitrospirae bacterium]|nr:HDOD domain-containing protein [Nitrospirota bacterium]